MISLFAKLLKLLNSEQNPTQLALGICFGALLGVTPLLSPLNILWLFLLLVIRINLSLFFIAWGGFTLIAYLIDPVSHQLGLLLLQSETLEGFWQTLYNNSFWRFIGFNNTLILGSNLIAFALFMPLFIASKQLVVRYRQHLLQWVGQSKLMLWLKGGKLYSAYQSIAN